MAHARARAMGQHQQSLRILWLLQQAGNHAGFGVDDKLHFFDAWMTHAVFIA